VALGSNMRFMTGRCGRFALVTVAFGGVACGGTPDSGPNPDWNTPTGSGRYSPGGGAASSGGALGIAAGGTNATGTGGAAVGGTAGVGPGPGAGGSSPAGAGGTGGTVTSGGSTGSGGGAPIPISYPPLNFAAIGRPVPISSQFLFAEGPVWDPAKQVLFFTDINGDTIYRLTLPATFDVFLRPTENADGLGLDPQGNLIAAGFVSRSVWRLVGTTIQTIASSYQGKKLNSPDDIAARSDGMIYFTDPLFGIDGSQGLTAQPQELGFQGVYRVTNDGAVHLEDESTFGPNGVEFSPDESSIYVSYTGANEVDEYSVAVDGSLSGRRLFAGNLATADSMCVDAAGDVYVAIVGGIAVLSPAGARLGTISMSQVPTNCTFGGPQQNTLFITARTGLIGTPLPGNSSIYRIDNMPIPGIPGR
jgi:gluconolactonase